MGTQANEYSAQLEEIFGSCDGGEKGFLIQPELRSLCSKLQIEHLSNKLIQRFAAGKPEFKVTFSEFKGGFLAVLQQAAADDTDSESEDNLSPAAKPPSPDAVLPKYVLGSKRYGRRSKPNVTDEELAACLPLDFSSLPDMEEENDDNGYIHSEESTLGSTNRHLSSSSMSDKDSGPGLSKRRKKSSQGAGEETFEADGQLNLSVEELGPEEQEHVEHFHEIWQALGVGRNGYLVLDELGKVCRHIGMGDMGQQDLIRLFEKLDADRDGRVSFEEFVEGLYHYKKPKSTTPRPPSAQRKMWQYLGGGPEERNVTPVMTGGTPMAFFSSIDPHHTGFAKAEDIEELWERMNIPHAPEVLQTLGFSLDRRISLAELSSALEQELILDTSDPVYQASLLSLQQELRTLRSEVEQAMAERDKLRLDLQEANARNALLAREGDERQASLERSSEMRVLTIEKRYQEEVQSLQTALEQEREMHSTSTARLRQSLQNKMEDIRQEEARMKDHLQQAQKEIQRLEQDLAQSNERLSEERKQKVRLQSQLDAHEMAQRQRAERESSGMHVSAHLENAARSRLEQLEAENKRLKDNNDELVCRLEQVRQDAELGRSKSQWQGKGSRATRIPVREGSSALSDSGRSSGRRRSILSVSSDASELDEEGSPPERRNRRMRRKLPGTPSIEDEALSSGEFDRRNQLGPNTQELLERERKELEHAFRLEVASLEEKQEKEKADILKNFEQEKKKLVVDCERKNQERLAEMTQELTNSFAVEKRDLIQKHESEKNLMEVKYAEEKKKLIERTQKEAERSHRRQVLELQESQRQEKEELRRSYEMRLADLEANLSKERTSMAELRMRNADLSCRMQVQENDLKHDFDAEKRKLREDFEKEKQELSEDCEEQRSRLQAEATRCRRELQTLREENDKLRQDLDTMKAELEDEFQRETDKLLCKFAGENDKVTKVITDLQRAKADLELRLKLQGEELRLAWEAEREELRQQARLDLLQAESQHRQEIQAFDNMLTGGLACLRGKLRDDFFAILQQEKEKELEKERHSMRRKLQEEETELVASMQQQKASLRKAFEEEQLALMEKYEGQIKELNAQLRELRTRLDEEQRVLAETLAREQAKKNDSLTESVKKTLEADYAQQLEKTRAGLEREKASLEREKEEAEEKEKEAESRATHLQEALEAASKESQVVRERNDQLTSTVEQLRSSIQTLEQAKETLEREKEKLEREKGRLERDKERLERQIELLERRKEDLEREKEETEARRQGEVERLQKRVDELLKENETAVVVQAQSLQAAQPSMVELNCLREEKASMARELATVRDHLDQVQAKLDFLQSVQGEDPLQRLEDERLQLQAQISGLQSKLSQSRMLQQELLRIQEDYSQTRQEKADLEALVADLQHQLQRQSPVQQQHASTPPLSSTPPQQQQQQSSTASSNHLDDMNNLKTDKRILESRFQSTSQKLLETAGTIEAGLGEVAGELSGLRARGWARGQPGEGNVDLETYTRLQVALVTQQRHSRSMQEALRQREEDATQLLHNLETEWQRKMVDGEAERKDLAAKLELRHQLLKEQTEKLKEALETSTRRNQILKELYVENAELMKSLQTSEERHRAAQRRLLQQEKQGRALQRTLHKIYKAGLAGWPNVSPAATAPL